jgi:hypothetical protein
VPAFYSIRRTWFVLLVLIDFAQVDPPVGVEISDYLLEFSLLHCVISNIRRILHQIIIDALSIIRRKEDGA